jgi:hypothetical protein
MVLVSWFALYGGASKYLVHVAPRVNMGSLGNQKRIAYIAHNLTRQCWAVWAIVERLPKLPIRAWRLGAMGAFWRVG